MMKISKKSSKKTIISNIILRKHAPKSFNLKTYNQTNKNKFEVLDYLMIHRLKINLIVLKLNNYRIIIT